VKISINAVLACCLLLPGALVLVAPSLHLMAPVVMMAGFAVLILSFLVISFRKNRLGPLAQYTEPAKFFGTVFTPGESLLLRTSACLGFGGALAVGLLLLTG
jgi:hypothetical protein